MSYDANERSVDKGAPVEFYKFTGELDVYRYTTDNVPGVCAGELYVPLPGGITRNGVMITGELDTPVTVDVTLPADTDVARRYCYKTTPGMLSVEIRRAHRGDDWNTDFEIEWHGYGMETSVSGSRATIKTGSLVQAKLSGILSPIYYQRLCNHELYDAQCGVDRNDHLRNAFVTKVQNQVITVDFDGGVPNQYALGDITVARTGERRSVFSSLDNSLIATFPFLDIVVGDEVVLALGCDHQRLGHCKQRFNNVDRYGGFDFVPSNNIIADFDINTEYDEYVMNRDVQNVGLIEFWKMLTGQGG